MRTVTLARCKRRFITAQARRITATQVNLLRSGGGSNRVFPYYKQLYTDLRLYEQVRPQIYRYLISKAEHS